MLLETSTPYSILNENESKNQITIEQSKMIVPALLINAITLSNTSLATYLAFGNLYSGNSDIYVLLVFL